MVVSKGRKRKRNQYIQYNQGAKKMRMTVVAKPSTVAVQKFAQTLNQGLNPYRYKGQQNWMKPEIKYKDIACTSTITQNGTLNSLTGIAQGIGVSERIGNQIYCRNVVLRMNIQQNASSANDTDFIRVMVLIDKEADVNPAVSDILESANTIAHYNWKERGRFQYLWDEQIALNPFGTRCVSKVISVPIRRVLTYDGTLTTDINRNQIYFLVLGAYTSNYPFIDCTARIKYTDQ